MISPDPDTGSPGRSSHLKAVLLPVLFLIVAPLALAGSATWRADAISNNWNDPANWTPATVPNGPADVATFDSSNQAALSLSANIEIAELVFNPGAGKFVITVPSAVALTLSGLGVSNNSGVEQDIVLATGALGAGALSFKNSATADNATLVINAAQARGATAGQVTFSDHATAGKSTIRAEKGGHNYPEGKVSFTGDSDGGTSRIQLLGSKGNLSLVGRSSALTVGSIEGRGTIDTSDTPITVGGNNLDATFSGVITGHGSLIKVGGGRLVLTGSSTYTGENGPVAGTVVSQGTFLVNNKIGSGTGSGSVLVQAGTMGGTGIVAGSLMVGDGERGAAFLTQGDPQSPRARLTVQSNLSFLSDATLQIRTNSDSRSVGTVTASGVTINGAQFSISDTGHAVLKSGTVLTLIDNTAATAISGTFGNLSDGGTITAGSNTFQANYEGGDGNDFTLTVVP